MCVLCEWRSGVWERGWSVCTGNVSQRRPLWINSAGTMVMSLYIRLHRSVYMLPPRCWKPRCTPYTHTHTHTHTHLVLFYTPQRHLTMILCRSQWCGLRPSVVGQDRSQTKKSVLVLVQVWCCVVKHGLVTLVVIMMLKDTATFQALFIVSLYSVLWTSLLWRSTVALITYLKVKSSKCLCLLPMVLVLVLGLWSCLRGHKLTVGR